MIQWAYKSIKKWLSGQDEHEQLLIENSLYFEFQEVRDEENSLIEQIENVKNTIALNEKKEYLISEKRKELLLKLENENINEDIKLKSREILNKDISLELYKIRSKIEISRSNLQKLEEKLKTLSLERSRIESKIESFGLKDEIEMGIIR